MLIEKGEQEIAASAQRLKETAKPLKQHDMYRDVEGSVPVGREPIYASLAKVCIAHSDSRSAYYADVKGIRGGRRGEGNEGVSPPAFTGHRLISPPFVTTACDSKEMGKGKSVGRMAWASAKKSARRRRATLQWVDLRTQFKGVRSAFKQDVVESISGLAKHICGVASDEALLGVEASMVSLYVIIWKTKAEPKMWVHQVCAHF